MTGEALFDRVLLGLFVLAPIVFLYLTFVSAPYGRHGRSGWGPELGARAAWLVMETPAVVGFAIFFFMGPRALEPVPLVLFALWQIHYVDRTFIYPWRIRPGGAGTPWVVALAGAVFQMANSYVNGHWLSSGVPDYSLTWLMDPRFIVGVVMFVVGYGINRWADRTLRNLRKPGETGHKIPYGGLYELISCPNYFGELVMWSGFALACWSLAGLSFVFFTAANLVPRAITNHKWYQGRFEDYPKKRRAIFPYVF